MNLIFFKTAYLPNLSITKSTSTLINLRISASIKLFFNARRISNPTPILYICSIQILTKWNVFHPINTRDIQVICIISTIVKHNASNVYSRKPGGRCSHAMRPRNPWSRLWMLSFLQSYVLQCTFILPQRLEDTCTIQYKYCILQTKTNEDMTVDRKT